VTRETLYGRPSSDKFEGTAAMRSSRDGALDLLKIAGLSLFVKVVSQIEI
jgi:hypothetical protein